jgi:hypothetical protein
MTVIGRGGDCVRAMPCGAPDHVCCFDFEASEMWRLRGIAPVHDLIDAILA